MTVLPSCSPIDSPHVLPCGVRPYGVRGRFSWVVSFGNKPGASNKLHRSYLCPWKLTSRSDQRHIGTLAGKLNELNKKVADIQREQRYMREVEEQFRDLSEATNARAVWYCIAQIVVLVAAGVWQMRHLKVYFEDKKLR